MQPFLGWISILIISFFVTGIGACADESDKDLPSPTCERVSLTDPGSVLDGTDILGLQDFRRSELPSQLGGTYRSEQGGAEVELTITPGAKEQWTVMRTFLEPGLDPETKEYLVEKCGPALVSLEQTFIIQGTKEGLLVLELKSGLESISPEYWVHYYQVQ